MPTTTFDPRIDIAGNAAVRGEFTKPEVTQAPGALGEVSNMVVDPTRPFTIDLEWQLDGVLGNVNSLLNDIGTSPEAKRWHVHVYAEKMGPGDDLEIYHGHTPDDSVVPVVAADFPATWQHTCDIPANVFEEHAPGAESSGMYRLCIVVFANTDMPGGLDIIGCYEGPIILAENPA
jgi:hypothetical protein